MNSSDNVRKIVQEEGRTARNLVQYNVLLEDEEVPGMITRILLLGILLILPLLGLVMALSPVVSFSHTACKRKHCYSVSVI